uniref:Uncharacterized protein n=1 Tax=viral metagenome TaxID=1070528 RepID=A0A6M3LDY6_9ZZZZ
MKKPECLCDDTKGGHAIDCDLAPQDNWEEEKELFEEIAREWLREAPPMETIYRFKRIWGWRIQKHLNECEELVKKILQNKQH